MKKLYTLLFAVLAMGFMAHTYSSTAGLSSVIVSFLGDEPVLPSTPFNYKVELPDHLMDPPTDTTGYGTGQIDTTILPLIQNETATLGRVLFYDKSLSANENISCGSCHLQSNSFADNKKKSVGVTTETKRNSMQLNDLGWSNNSSFFWDKKKKDLFDAVELPLKDENEVGATLEDMLFKMGQSTFYPTLFQNAYGDTKVTEERILESLGQFIASMNSFNSKFDKVSDGEESFTTSESNGRNVFAETCGFCHVQGNRDLEIFGVPGEDLMSELIFTYNGYDAKDNDYGAMDTSLMKLPLFKLPTMKNIELTAPYMHDGGIPDLDSLIDFYSHGVTDDFQGFVPAGGFNFDEETKADLKAFLLTLTDKTMATNPKWADPFASPNNVSDTDLGAVVTIMPNPFDHLARVTIDGYDQMRKDVTLHNMSGKLLKTDYFLGNEYTLLRDQLSSGVYIITIRCNNKVGSYKLMIQ